MKIRTLLHRSMTTLILLSPAFAGRAQIAQWTFDNLLTGIPSLNVLTDPATLGPSIPLNAFNAGTAFYGEGGWPAGALDPNAYLQFTVRPTAAYSLTISSMLLAVRRSTTGTGAGPNSWSLRSSLDGYTADISSGTVSMSSSPAIPVTFNASFAHLSVPVTFRLYGYNMTLTPGGLNRFVFDQITVGGATILPVLFGDLSASLSNGRADLRWTMASEEGLKKMMVQRARNGGDFRNLATISTGQDAYTYSDNALDSAGLYSYRIALLSQDNDVSYSPVRQLTVAATGGQDMRASWSAGGSVRIRFETPGPGAYTFTLYDMNGTPVNRQAMNLVAGTQTVGIDATRAGKGVYLVRAESAGRSSVSRIIIP